MYCCRRLFLFLSAIKRLASSQNKAPLVIGMTRKQVNELPEEIKKII